MTSDHASKTRASQRRRRQRRGLVAPPADAGEAEYDDWTEFDAYLSALDDSLLGLATDDLSDDSSTQVIGPPATLGIATRPPEPAYDGDGDGTYQGAPLPHLAPGATDGKMARHTTNRVDGGEDGSKGETLDGVLLPAPSERSVDPAMVDRVDRSLGLLADVAGFIAGAVVDAHRGITLRTIGGSAEFDIGVAAAVNSEVYAAKLRAAEAIGQRDEIEDILITLGTQYHVIRPGEGGVFFYVAVDRAATNPVLLRRAVASAEQRLRVS